MGVNNSVWFEFGSDDLDDLNDLNGKKIRTKNTIAKYFWKLKKKKNTNPDISTIYIFTYQITWTFNQFLDISTALKTAIKSNWKFNRIESNWIGLNWILIIDDQNIVQILIHFIAVEMGFKWKLRNAFVSDMPQTITSCLEIKSSIFDFFEKRKKCSFVYKITHSQDHCDCRIYICVCMCTLICIINVKN